LNVFVQGEGAVMVETETNLADRSTTLDEFCALEHISLATYYKMRRLGYGPEEMRYPNTNVVRITAAARAAWHQRMQALQHSRAAKVEAKRRQKQTSEAGRLAAQSPRHVQRRKARR
jgi:hypothetical protein